MAATKIKKRQIENLQIVDADIAAAAAIAISKIAGLNDALDSKEPAFSKNTAFNKNFGTASGTVAEGDHTHSFSQLTDIPTTLAGFGITDAFTKAEVEAITGDLGNLETTDKSNLVAALNELNGVVSDAVKPPLPIDCSGNPDYPAANKGDSYKVTKVGLIGGENGISVDVGDLMIASVDTPAGDHATVGANWGIYQANLDKATESVFGTGRIATTAEVTAGTNDQAWVTPAKLAAGFFSKTQLQTSGQAQVHFGNITSTPTTLGGYGINDAIFNNYTSAGWLKNLPGGSGVDANSIPGANIFYIGGTVGNTNFPQGASVFLSLRHSAGPGAQLTIRGSDGAFKYRGVNASGEGQWYDVASTQYVDNLPGLVPQTLSLSGENLSISGGNSVSLYGLGATSPTLPADLNELEGAMFSSFTVETLNRPPNASGNRGGIIQMTRAGNPSKFQLGIGNNGDIHARTLAAAGWGDWKEYPDKTWVTGQINSGATLNAVLNKSVAPGYSVVGQADNFTINLAPPGSGGWDRGYGLWQPNVEETGVIGGAFGVHGSGNASINYAYLVVDNNNTASNMGGRNSPGLRIYPSGQDGLRYYYDSSEKQVWHAGNLTPVDAAKYVAKEALAGAKDGTNKTFTLANTPIAGKEMIFLNGQLLQSGSGADYTISGTTVTLTDNQAAPVADDVILGTYIY